MPRAYQYVVVDGKEYGRRSEATSSFYNEGKWRNFIAPFLPDDCSGMTFLDFGCNYGLHLKMAQERGFTTTLGIERDKRLRAVTAKCLGRAGQVKYRTIGPRIFRNSFIANLPAADFILMANFHYHLRVPPFMHAINLLRHKTRYLIVVSVERPPWKKRRRAYRVGHDIGTTRRYFRAWTEAGHISGISTQGDPSPREGMYSLLFKTDVERVRIGDIKWRRKELRAYHIILKEVRESGQRFSMNYPCLLRQDGRLLDGQHRLAAQELEGATTVLAEKV
jgi:SAM-dependent methyltransferase